MPAERPTDFPELADSYRRELLAHCYRMLGSVHDAEDLVQETMLRAWRGFEQFDGRSSVRTWLYRIATNACLTALQSRQRRVLPSGLGSADDDYGALSLERADAVPWITPLPTSSDADPAEVATLRDSTRLALVVALQHLPARQRAVLLLVEVVGFDVGEAAAFLGVSYPAARSLLQRARATLKIKGPAQDEVPPATAEDGELLARYLSAFEAADTAGLARILRDDAQYEMPPMRQWFRGPEPIVAHHHARVWTRERRAVPVRANGLPAMASYTRPDGGAFELHAIHVVEPVGDRIGRIVVFLDSSLAGPFGLPPVLDAA